MGLNSIITFVYVAIRAVIQNGWGYLRALLIQCAMVAPEDCEIYREIENDIVGV